LSVLFDPFLHKKQYFLSPKLSFQMTQPTSNYEASIIGDAQSADPNSPISYVRGLLGKTVLIILTDGYRSFSDR
jgi:hypothetical protein